MPYDIIATGAESDALTAASSEADKAPITEEKVVEEKETTDKPADQVDSPESKDGKPTDTKEGEGEEDAPTYYWGDMAVEVEVPEDISAAFTEKGLDVNEYVSELFAKDGKFELSADKRTKLEEAFGKPLVDGYLNLYKKQNEMAINDFKTNDAKVQAQVAENTKGFTEMFGDTGFDELNDWAATSLSETELSSVNAVMALPPEHWEVQKMVLEQLKGRMSGGSPEKPEIAGRAADQLPPEEGEAAGMPKTLTRAQYQAEMFKPEWKNPEYQRIIDGIRQKSITQGIQ
ncbi:MAG: hypothetical protein [Caudoviricetes sp.]|nr:MAG: hypothetical protein [Caudoviricetes sp.]